MGQAKESFREKVSKELTVKQWCQHKQRGGAILVPVYLSTLRGWRCCTSWSCSGGGEEDLHLNDRRQRKQPVTAEAPARETA